MKYLIIFVIVIGALGLGAYAYVSRAKAAAAANSAPPATDTVSRRTIQKLVSANGKVASNRDVDIKCQASGTIQTLTYTDVSKEVKPGELLCKLDPKDEEPILITAKARVQSDQAKLAEAQQAWQITKMSLDTTRQRDEAALASAKAQAADAHAKADRTKQLYEAKPTALASAEELSADATTAAEMDAAAQNAQTAIAELDQLKITVDTKEQDITVSKATLAQDQAGLTTAQQNYDYCNVYAPAAENPKDPPRWFISSMLTNIAPGYVVQSGTSGFSAGTTIMTLSDLSHVYVLASVDESNIGQVADPERGGEKQNVRTTVDAFPGQVFDGEVVRIAPKGVNTSNVVTFEVKIEVTSSNRMLLRPEMTTTSDIICAARNDVLTVPATDFARTGDKSDKGDKGDRGHKSDNQVAAAPGDASASAPATMPASAPATRRGRGNGKTAGGAVVEGAPEKGTVSVLTAAGTTESRDIVVGLLGNDPTDPAIGDLYEVISGLQEGDEAVRQSGQDSKFRGPSANQMMRGIGGGRGR